MSSPELRGDDLRVPAYRIDWQRPRKQRLAIASFFIPSIDGYESIQYRSDLTATKGSPDDLRLTLPCSFLAILDWCVYHHTHDSQYQDFR